MTSISYINYVQGSVNFCNERSGKRPDILERVCYTNSIEHRNERGNKMKNQEIRNTVAELQQMYADYEILKTKISEKESLIKTELDNRELEVLDLGNVIIRFTNILSNRFDTTTFKKLHKDLYNEFIKQVASRRFSIA